MLPLEQKILSRMGRGTEVPESHIAGADTCLRTFTTVKALMVLLLHLRLMRCKVNCFCFRNSLAEEVFAFAKQLLKDALAMGVTERCRKL